jgi:hypothetical protein
VLEQLIVVDYQEDRPERRDHRTDNFIGGVPVTTSINGMLYELCGKLV